MNKINPEFNIPYYVFEEIVDYIECKNNSKCSNWEKVKMMLQLAVINNRLTESQSNFLIQTYNREKN